MMFGISKSFKPSTSEWVGSSETSWSINRCTGFKCHKARGIEYAQDLISNPEGQIVEVILDTKEGVLSFRIDGEFRGVAF